MHPLFCRVATVALFAAAAGLLGAQIRYVAPLTSTEGPPWYGSAKLGAFWQLSRVAAAPDGTLYLSAGGQLSRVTPDGEYGPYSASFGSWDTPGGGPSINTYITEPYALDVDDAGNLYVASHHKIYRGQPAIRGSIRRIGPDGIVHTIPTEVIGAGIAVGPDGDLFVASGPRVWRVTQAGEATILAEGTDAYDIDVARDGTIYIAEPYAHRIRRLEPGGALVTVAGTGEQGFGGDGGRATDARLSWPFGAKLDSGGNLYIAEYGNHRVRVVTPDGTIHTVAGNGQQGYYGDGGPATAAKLDSPVGVTLDAQGHLLIADTLNGRLRRVDQSGTITTVAGCGITSGCSPDGLPLKRTRFVGVRGMVEDVGGSIYLAEETNHRVRKIDRNGVVSTVAGVGEAGFTGDGGPATEARLAYPADVAFDVGGNLYIADQQNHRIRRVLPDGTIETYAGTGRVGAAGDGGPANEAELANPEGVAFDAAGNLYIADTVNHKIRKINPEGVISTHAGTGVPGSQGDGGLATMAQLLVPKSIAVAADGTVDVADLGADRVRRITTDGIIQTVSLGRQPLAVTRDPAGNLYIGYVTEPGQLRVLEPDATERILDRIDARGTISNTRADGLLHTSAGAIWIATAGVIFSAVASPAALPEAPPVLASVVNGAASRGYGIAPGTIVTLWGSEFGPEVAVNAAPVAGSLPAELAGVRVSFDGVAAPLLMVSSRQINAVAPFGLEPGGLTRVVVEHRGELTNPWRVPVVAASPAVFSGAVLNQDYTPNASNNRARPGDAISVWATGLGPLNPPLTDGQVVLGGPPLSALPVRATIGGQPAEVLYAGAAPGFVAGCYQINLLVPEGTQPHMWEYRNIVILAGNGSTNDTISVWVEDPGAE